jgi:hypothetical protein
MILEHGKAGRGMVGSGTAWSGEVRRDLEILAWLGEVGQDMAWQREVWSGVAW